MIAAPLVTCWGQALRSCLANQLPLKGGIVSANALQGCAQLRGTTGRDSPSAQPGHRFDAVGRPACVHLLYTPPATVAATQSGCVGGNAASPIDAVA